MKKHFPKLILILLFLLIIIFAEIYILSEKNSSVKKNYTITLTEEGFSPDKITINKEDTIIFKTTRNTAFWPASNLHPTHSIYPEFDPKQSIEPDKSWQFRFEKEGEWKYHDHLSPLFKGAVIVKQNSKLGSCKAYQNNNQIKCWEDLIDRTLKDKGLGEAFELMGNLYRNEPKFASSCHDFAHKLGAEAYQLFSINKDLQLSEKSSYCGYGFYHGFMESLLQTSGNMNQAREFCKMADEQLKITTSDAGGACFHGIGHGAVDGSDPRFWGDAQAMVNKSLDLCEKVSDDENPPPRYGKLFRCVSGAFNGLEILSTSNQYKLSLNKDDPFWICKIQPDRYKEACYTQFVVAVISISGGDFVKSAKIISSIKEDGYALPSLQSLVVEFAHSGSIDYNHTINFCRSLESRFHEICISSLAEGLMKYGLPQSEYLESLKFCSSPLLTEKEKLACFGKTLEILRVFYTAEKSKNICQTVEQKYRVRNCQYN